MVLGHTTRGSLVLALLLLAGALPVSAAFSGTATRRPPGQARETVVIKVDGGLCWLDVGLGAAAALAVVALVHGLVLVVRRDGSANPERSGE